MLRTLLRLNFFRPKLTFRLMGSASNLQIDEEVAKLLELKANLGSGGKDKEEARGGKLVLKVPKVRRT